MYQHPPELNTDNLYRKRDDILRGMGFKTYAEYLQSDLWASIRTQVLQRDGFRCFVCNRKANQVHHETYSKSVLMGQPRSMKYLKSVCRTHHREAEFFQGQKLQPVHVWRRLRELRDEHTRRRRSVRRLVFEIEKELDDSQPENL